MRDGCIIGRGLETRIGIFRHHTVRDEFYQGVKRKKVLSMEKFRRSMEGIYSTSVKKSTFDESPLHINEKMRFCLIERYCATEKL